MKAIGEKIFNLRKEKGVSQEALALELGVARQTVSKWEMDATQPTLENVESMCAFFGVSATYFFESEESAVSAAEEQSTITAQVKEEKFKTLKTVLIVVGAVALAFCIIFGLMAFYEVVSSDAGNGYDFVATTCFLIGGIAAAILVTLLVLLIKKHRKK